MKKPNKFKSDNPELDKGINAIVDGLYGQSLAIVSWMRLVGKFITSLDVEQQKIVRNHLFPLIDQLEDELDDEIFEIEEQFVEPDNTENKDWDDPTIIKIVDNMIKEPLPIEHVGEPGLLDLSQFVDDDEYLPLIVTVNADEFD